MSEVTKIKKIIKPIERVTISDTLKAKLQDLCDQANGSLQGMSIISKSDIINLLLEVHETELSKLEIERLKSAHFDEVKFAQWVTNRLKMARTSGESVSLMELIAQGKDLVGRVHGNTPRRPRKRKDAEPEALSDQDKAP